MSVLCTRVCVYTCVCYLCVLHFISMGYTASVCMSIRLFFFPYVYVCESVCVYVCVYTFFFLSLTMKYLTLSILFQFIEGEGIPTGGDRIGYTYTLTPIIKLSYFLFNRYKTTTCAAISSAFHQHFCSFTRCTLSRRARVSLFLFLSLSLSLFLASQFTLVSITCIHMYLSPVFPARPSFKRTTVVRMRRRCGRSSVASSLLIIAFVLVSIIFVVVTVGTVNKISARIA